MSVLTAMQWLVAVLSVPLFVIALVNRLPAGAEAIAGLFLAALVYLLGHGTLPALATAVPLCQLVVAGVYGYRVARGLQRR